MNQMTKRDYSQSRFNSMTYELLSWCLNRNSISLTDAIKSISAYFVKAA